ncbi:MAG: zinc ABC transporter substrate-binding protein [Streptosporangiales bacterium]|nr:zinc ABC transporter substrate-binding protein [Streptosporangiales bacterium]
MALPFAAACGSGQSATTDTGGRLRVVATTTQVADFARNVGGDRVHVTQLLKPNVDPHDFEPAPADLQAISKAELVIENGVGLEEWLHETIESAGFDGATVDASKGVTLHEGGAEHEEGTQEHEEGGEEAEHEHGEEDPHIWQDPRNAKKMSATIAAALEKADPSHKAEYQADLESYEDRLDRLDADIAKQISSIPKDQRRLVTNHDAFGYYVERYDLTFVGSIIPSFDTSAELSGKELDTLVGKIKAQHVKAVFSEASLPPKTAETIGTRAGVTVVAGEDALYGDTLGPAGSDAATYIAMMEHNTKTIVGALRG